MNKTMKRNLKYVGCGILMFVFVMGFTFANYMPAKAQLRRAPTTVQQVPVGASYGLELQGQVIGYFTEAYNMGGSEHEVVEQKTVDNKGKQVIKKVPGRLKISDIILKRGITNNMELWRWRQQVVDGDMKSARRDGSLAMYDNTLKEVARWNFTQAWPSKLISNPVDASATSPSGGMAIEQVNIAVEQIIRMK